MVTVPAEMLKQSCDARSEATLHGIEPLCEDCEGCSIMQFVLTEIIPHCIVEVEGTGEPIEPGICYHDVCYDPSSCDNLGDWLSRLIDDIEDEAYGMALTIIRLLKEYGI